MNVSLFRRFARFSIVGAGGIVVQTLALAALLRFSDIHYMLATALAVELSVLNNFVWHRRWTWADRRASRTALALLRFNATTGAMSLAGNLVFMFLLVSGLRLDPRAANLIAIGLCSLVNFALSDRFVFV
ncbi:MAG TPA: GtrA family protein [Blastocatellia bacterium]|nr:GtrA family protein [Blastocatellia bacterium]